MYDNNNVSDAFNGPDGIEWHLDADTIFLDCSSGSDAAGDVI